MKRRILMALLALGAVGGYASGFAHMHRCSHNREAAFERHVADVCLASAKGTPPPAPFAE
jgi:hypothetical protein